MNATIKEIQKMLGMYLRMGLVQMAGTRMYWETDTRNSPVADVMSRNRFQSLLTTLHFMNNSTVSETEKRDKLWKNSDHGLSVQSLHYGTIDYTMEILT